MLTQNDLEKIKTVVDGVVNQRADGSDQRIDSLDKKFTKKLSHLEKKFDKRFNTLEKKLDITTDFLDGEIIDLKKRTDRAEDVLNLSPIPA